METHNHITLFTYAPCLFFLHIESYNIYEPNFMKTHTHTHKKKLFRVPYHITLLFYECRQAKERHRHIKWHTMITPFLCAFYFHFILVFKQLQLTYAL